MKTLVGYMRNGKLESLDRTLKGLLIGYDLIPLIGLSNMKRRLKEKGTFHRYEVRPVSKGVGDCFCLFKGDRPVHEFLTWSSPYKEFGKAAKSACGFISDEKMRKENLADYQECWRLWMWDDKKHDWRAAKRFLEARGYFIRPVKLASV